MARTAAQVAASKRNLEKARAARKKNALAARNSAPKLARGIATRADKGVAKGRFGTGKSSAKVLIKKKTQKQKAEQKSWDRDRYNNQKTISITGTPFVRANKKSTRFGVATTSTGKKITKPRFKRRRRTTAK